MKLRPEFLVLKPGTLIVDFRAAGPISREAMYMSIVMLKNGLNSKVLNCLAMLLSRFLTSAVRAKKWHSMYLMEGLRARYCSSTNPPDQATINQLEEVKSISNQQKLYMIDPTTPGSIFFLPHGARLFNKLVEFMKVQQRMFGFEEVITPVIYKKDLWKRSGHWAHYKRDMFEVFGADHGEQSADGDMSSTENKSEYSLKPMNCPGHCLIFSRHERSFRELPIRLTDYSPLHRNEASGALTGLTRVRKFHQDDGHIFCMPDQVETEMNSCLKLIDTVYRIFGLDDYELTLSTRPETFIGTVEVWDRAEANLKEALNRSGKPWTVNEGDGAFYGPKIDILVKDNLGKQHQTATIQLDFQLPENFALEFTTSSGTQHRPVMIHRAIYGSIERFMAILIDHYQGKWPFWINPRQALVIPVSAKHAEYAQSVAEKLSGKLFTSNTESVPAGKLGAQVFNVEVALQDEPVNVRIRRAISENYSFILMVGDREVESNTVTMRPRGSRATQTVTVEELHQHFCKLQNEYA
ncbi:threonine--tRNA ligase MST1 [Sugiyamaella lignohabitans]|uniref:threonine--tRNA ligase n=1 Tax=Sugiyamaella lignohabitans TaxID=796027 RepID=A0A167FF71_9ASCO|nr:threonine--tRNA ligase MST1 [Sugiyamaella lignohabitans]ANB15222.1 threonine--tRNA ligase MST1 [Sugiyamaella lignohabitans]